MMDNAFKAFGILMIFLVVIYYNIGNEVEK